MTTYVAGRPRAMRTTAPAAQPAAAEGAPAGAPPATDGRAVRSGRRARTGRTGRAERSHRPDRPRGADRDGRTAGSDGIAGSGVPAGNGPREDGAARPPAPKPGARPAAVRPRADCTADSAGGLTFDVRLGGGAATAAPAPGGGALLLRMRGAEGPEDTVRLPLGPAEDEGTLRAVLPSIMSLPEGRWDAYLALDGKEPRRLLPGVHDLRSLIGRVPRQGRTWLGVRIPYATKYGNLTIRSWLRWPHAEAGPVRVSDGCMVLEGRLYGARVSATARLEAHPRDESEEAHEPVSVPVLLDGAEESGDGGGESGKRTGEGNAPGFSARLPLDILSFEQRVWDLWVRPSAEEEPVRLGRILDDVPDKGQIFSYPPQRVTGPEGAFYSVRPYYTLDNDLSVRVSCDGAV